jgi:hypothetical protein
MRKLLFTLVSVLSLSQAMSDDISWVFPSTLLSTPSANASSPQIASDANGNLVAVWVENGSVVTKSKILGMNWDPTGTVLSNSTAIGPTVVCDPSGNATAVWLENGIVKASSKLFMGTWGSTATLSSGGAGYPNLVVNTSGDVIAAWPRHGNIETSTKRFGMSWGNIQAINSSNANFQQMAISGTGSSSTAVIVWQTSNGQVTTISAATKTLSAGNWSAPQTISDPLSNAGFPSVAMDSKGNATAAWFYYELLGSNYKNVIVKSVERPAGGSWTNPVALSAPGIRNPSTLTVKVGYDNFGNAIALWNTSFDNETFNLEAAIKPPTGKWSSPTDILSSNLYGLSADLEVDSIGDALALYMFYNGSSLNIQSSQSDITGFMNNQWTVPRFVSIGTNNAYPQGVSIVRGNGINAAAIWLQSNGTNNQILATTGTKSLPLPPTGAHVTQHTSNLGVYQDHYNMLSWTASTDPTVVGYLIYRNGLFLEQVSNNITQILDHNQVANGAVTYGIASVDAQNTRSTFVTVSLP